MTCVRRSLFRKIASIRRATWPKARRARAIPPPLGDRRPPATTHPQLRTTTLQHLGREPVVIDVRVRDDDPRYVADRVSRCGEPSFEQALLVWPPHAAVDQGRSRPVGDQVDVDMFDAVMFDGQQDPGDAVESRGPVCRRNHGIGSTRLVGAQVMMRCARSTEATFPLAGMPSSSG
jgi:hypothetical protein